MTRPRLLPTSCSFGSSTQRTRQRRRRLKRRVYVFAALLVFIVYQYSQITALSTYNSYLNGYDNSLEQPQTSSNKNNNHVVLRDARGAVVSRNTTRFSNYLVTSDTSTVGSATKASFNSTLDQRSVRKDREPILAILKDAGMEDLDPSEILTLPTWTQVTDLYGAEPVIVGLNDACRAFQAKVPQSSNRFLGVSGMFNSGSTAFGISLQANCRFPHHAQNKSNDVVSDSNGMLNQVPWAKHKMATEKYNHTIQPEIPKEHVLPIVLVRDPYYWMQSMCKQGYGARWSHNPKKHCPNLVPNDFDRSKYKHLLNASSVPVWMGPSPQVGPSWPSLVHYWNAWYQSYVHADFPRLLIRFEDTLFHGQKVMKLVCECGGGELVSPNNHIYLLDEAKWQHKHAQNNMKIGRAHV